MERSKMPWGYDRSQVEFDRQGGLEITLIVWLFKLTVYLPFMMVSYLGAKPFTDPNTTAWKWILLIGVFTLLQLTVIYALKVWMAALRARDNGWWWLIFGLLFGYCCVFGMWVMYETLKQLLQGAQYGRSFGSIISIAFFINSVLCFKLFLQQNRNR